MKRYLTAAILPLLLLTGCLKEDWSLCSNMQNGKLLFRYQQPDGSDFKNNIRDVHVLLFDENYLFHRYAYTDAAGLDTLVGVHMNLSPGNYYVVCWGNADDNVSNSPVTEGSSMSGSYVQTQPQHGKRPIFYSPYKDIVTKAPASRANADYTVHRIEVKQVEFEETLYFFQAHRELNVYVIGYDDPVLGPDPQFDIKVTNLPCGYDFLLRVLPDCEDKDAKTEFVTRSGTDMQAAEMHTPYHEIADDIFIHVSAPGGVPIVAPINLAQFVADNNLPADPAQLHEINITLTYTGGTVTVTSEKWTDISTEPEI